jgi:hypothetical protein
MSGERKRDEESKGRLTYGDQSWTVETEPEVIEEDEGAQLVEVWVTEEGEESGESG